MREPARSNRQKVGNELCVSNIDFLLIVARWFRLARAFCQSSSIKSTAVNMGLRVAAVTRSAIAPSQIFPPNFVFLLQGAVNLRLTILWENIDRQVTSLHLRSYFLGFALNLRACGLLSFSRL